MLMLSDSPTAAASQVHVHLARHGVHADYGQVLSGRAGAAPLTVAGRAQAGRLARWALRQGVGVIHASPRSRTVETAALVAEALGAEVQRSGALDEIDFGAWNGRAFADLDGDPLWDGWNRQRSVAPTPGGETMAQAVARAAAHVATLGEAGTAALCVTHCDIIRGVIAHYLGLSLDHILRFDIDPGSVSTIAFGPDGARIIRINEVPA